MLTMLESPYLASFSLLAIVFGLIYWYSVNTFGYWKKKGVPYVKPVPFFGNVKDAITFKKNFAQVYQDLYNELEGHPYGGTFTFKKPALLLRDPEIIKAVLVKDFQHFHDRDIEVAFDRNPLAQHLLLLKGHKWRALRSKLSPTFTSGKMKNMFHIMGECCDNLTNHLEEPAKKGQILEMKDVLAKLTTDIVGSCVFGIQMNALDNPDSEFRRMGKKVFSPTIIGTLKPLVNLFLPKISDLFQISLFENDVTNFFINIVKETGEYRLKNNIKRNDFMQLLMNLRYKGKVDDDEGEEKTTQCVTGGRAKDVVDFEIDDNLAAAQAFVFFFAGFETSSSTMSFAVYELARNPDIQANLRQEIDNALKENGGKFTYESVMNMKYLDKVLSETLRMYSPVQFLRRGVTIPYKLPGTNAVLEKDLSVIIPIYAIQRDAKYYPDPDRFDPERFSEEEKAKRPNFVYLPFGDGPRNCIGMRFGLMQSKLGLATLLSKFEFHVCERTQIPMKFNPKGLILSSINGTKVRITNRA